MEDILDLYEEPYDPKRPVICFDERPCQLIRDLSEPIPMRPGNPERIDNEYERNGICSLFIAFEPKACYRTAQVRKQRTKHDYAEFMKNLAEQYPDADVIRVVQDNLNTHTTGSFYENLPPEEARELAKKFEFHYTPKKGSWLNMAEIELSAIVIQCLKRRLGSMFILDKEIQTCVKERNKHNATVLWRFNIKKARKKLYKFYYPKLS